MSAMKTILDKVLETIVAIILGLLVLNVSFQVLARYVFRLSTPWTEELAMFLMIWLSLLGACTAYRRQAHLGIDVLVVQFSARMQLKLNLLAHIFVIIFAVGILLAGGSILVYNTFVTHQFSAAMQVRMGYVYLALPISGFFLTVDAVQFMVESVQKIVLMNSPTGDRHV